MKRMLVCVLAPFGLAPLLAQDAPPSPVPQEPPPAPDAVPAPDPVPVTNAVPATNIVASTTVAASTNAVASTNVVVAIPSDIPATNAVITADASRSMTADEERVARDILRGIKVEPSPRVPDPKDYFDPTFVVIPIVGDKVYEIVRGNSNPSQHPFVKSSGESTNSTEVASTEKPKRKGKKKQKEIAASSPTVAPEVAATPDVAGNLAEPSYTPVSDEELRRKEIERIEAEVIKAAEERKLREGGTAGETVPGGANFTPAQPAVPEPAPATPAVPAPTATAPAQGTNATPAKPMTAEQEATTRAILESKSAEVFTSTNPAQTGLAPTPVNAREAKADQREEARQRAFAEAQRVKEERARVAETATPTPAPDQPASPTTTETPATVDPAAVAPAAPVAPPEGQLPPDVEAKARALLEKAMSETNAPATTVTAPTTLPTEKELKAQAKARRASEKAAAEEAKKQAREQKRQIEAQAEAAEKAQAAAKAEQRRQEKEAKKAKAAADKLAKEEASKAQKNASTAPAVTKTDAAVEQKPAVKTGDSVVRSWENASGKTKEQRLAELMDAYARDLISASEYHKARASIVSE